MTFADLMTLLMCFFVLILSFSELDILKYKQLAGSMAHAFGVQRDIEAKDPPKGINIIAREFSPGQPMPTPLNVVRQKTTSDLRIHLEVGGHKTRPTPTPRTRDIDPKDEVTMKPENPAQQKADQEIEQKAAQHADEQAGERAQELPGEQLTQDEIIRREEALQKKVEEMQAEQQEIRAEQEAIGKEREEIEKMKEEIRQREEALRALEPRLDDATAEEILAAREARERKRKLDEDSRKILEELEEQILAGSVDVEREGQKIIIRIREKASFASGSADVVASFKPVLRRLGEIIEGMEGRVIVAGHTDPIPISTARFRSNWELSAGRAVSVVHELLWQTAIPLERFLVQGHGETQPVAPNDTAAERALNRRVEIILLQGNDQEAEREITQRGVRQPAAATRAEPKPTAPDQGVEDAAAAVTETTVDVDGASTAAGMAAQPVTPVTPGVAEPTPEVVEAPPLVATPAEAAPAPAAAPDAARQTDAPRPGGSGVTAGAVRAPRPPSAPNPEQEMP
jgi:chemotaxis protein MotB